MGAGSSSSKASNDGACGAAWSDVMRFWLETGCSCWVVGGFGRSGWVGRGAERALDGSASFDARECRGIERVCCARRPAAPKVQLPSYYQDAFNSVDDLKRTLDRSGASASWACESGE